MGFSEKLKEEFEKSSIPAKLTVYKRTDSTNTRAKEHASASGERCAHFFVSETQSEGRGRMGRSFLSEEGGLYLSALIYPDMPIADAVKLTVFSAVEVCRLLEEFYSVNVGIKWVNDIYIGEKKLSGILTEGAFDESGEKFSYAVIGIGINFDKTEFPTELKNIATDLESECGIKADKAEFAIALIKSILSFSPAKTSEYIEEYRKKSIMIGRRVKVLSPLGDYFAEVQSIDDDAALIVKNDKNEIIRLYTGDVSIKIGGN